MSTVLVIDDNEDIRALLRRVLEREGYTVSEASDGIAGTRLYRSKPADVIITDIVMPDQEGIQTIMELLREFPTAKIIAISGGGTAISGETCLQIAQKLGAAYTFTKPLDLSRLLDAVCQLIEA
ncbi:MAG: response regulator [Desulfomonile tiedjei]|nr:response regulator [Desulfomonile tiedjei]